MLRNHLKYLIVLALSITLLGSGAWGWSPQYEPCAAAPSTETAEGAKGITKVKPSPSQVQKVRPGEGIMSGLGGISRWNPIGWGTDCYLPVPAKGQFVLGTRFTFMRLHGDVRHGRGAAGVPASLVNFDDHLGLAKKNHTVWSINAHYQFQPRWGIRYSFTPMQLEASHLPATTFTFGGQTFQGNERIRSKWEQYGHSLGLAFDVQHSANSVTTVLAEWRFIQERLTIGSTVGRVPSTTLDDDKSLAFLGLEFNKCLKNYRGSTLALTCMGGITFLDDHIGYDAEAALSYLIPIKRGRFGFVKGGYRYAQLRKDKGLEMVNTKTDGAFMEIGFLF